MTTLPIPPWAVEWNRLFSIYGIIGWIAIATVVGAMFYFTIKYRYRKGRPEPVISLREASRSRVKEALIFSSISIMLLLSLAIASYNMSADIHYPPTGPNTLTVNVVAFQWAFQFHYPNGVTTTDDCPVPGNTDIIFNVTSLDVMHNFGLPDFKLKIDAIPGRYNIMWLTTPTVTGNDALNYSIHCYELCGLGHTYMIANLTVMNPDAFNQWLNQAANASSNQSSGGS